MKRKVKLTDRRLFNNYLKILGIINIFLSFFLIAIPNRFKILVGVLLIPILLLVVYIILWIRANIQNTITLNINNSTMIIKTGDIFEESELKVIAFNEYFDTTVDNKIISEQSLNGKYIKLKVKDIKNLDDMIDATLKDKVVNTNNGRKYGKHNKYPLGTVVEHENFLLTAFTHFDDADMAYLCVGDYINFLFNFWNEIYAKYNGRSVSIPLLGSGITRFRTGNTNLGMSEQNLLELLIWSFKVSGVKLSYHSKISIVIDESTKDKINFLKLKEV